MEVPDSLKDRMDEFDYRDAVERSKRNYIKGMLFDIVNDQTDLETLTRNIVDVCCVSDPELWQKIILGEIIDCIRDDVSKSQLTVVSMKIATFLQKEKKD